MEAKANGELRQTIIGTREKYKGQVLSDQEIIDLVSTGNPEESGTIVQWLGSGIKKSETPVHRFSQILSDNFNKLTPEAKKQILLGGAKFVFGDFTYALQFKKQGRYSELTEAEYLGPQIPRETTLKNISELLTQTLEFTENNVQKARKFLSQVYFMPKFKKQQVVSIALLFFYGPKAETWEPNYELVKIKEEYLQKNSKLDLLAFWLDADLGNLNPRKSQFGQLLDSMFPKFDNAIKVQMMVFLKEQMLARKVPRRKYHEVARFLSKNQSFYEAVQNRYPNSLFLEAYDLTKKVLALDELQEKTKEGQITPQDLVTILETNQQLLTYVTRQELENALDRTKEHDLAIKIERLIKAKTKLPKIPS